jgi:hypothetical protein
VRERDNKSGHTDLLPIYGNVDVRDMRKRLNQLAFKTVAPAAIQEVPPALLAAGIEHSPLAANLLLEGQSPKGEGPGVTGFDTGTPGPSMHHGASRRNQAARE